MGQIWKVHGSLLLALVSNEEQRVRAKWTMLVFLLESQFITTNSRQTNHPFRTTLSLSVTYVILAEVTYDAYEISAPVMLQNLSIPSDEHAHQF